IQAVTTANNSAMLSLEELRAAFRKVGGDRYHHRHPFHLLMHEGRLSRGQLQAWALNRYYYQSRIPTKDSIILPRSEDASFRRAVCIRECAHARTAGAGHRRSARQM